MTHIAVIGGGIIGGAIAWRLSREDVRVTLFERGGFGGEASTAGAGMLAPGGEVDAPGSFAEHLVAAARMYPDWVRSLEEAGGIAIDYRACGGLDRAFSDRDWVELFDRSARQQEIGIVSETHADGLYYPGDAIVDPAHVMSGLRAACVADGVELREHCEATTVEIAESRLRIQERRFDRAVLAAGAWSSSIGIPGVSLPAAYPVKGHLLGCWLPPGSVPHILRHGHTYILQRSNGFTIAGSSTENAGFDKQVDPVIAADIRRRAERLLPMLEGVEMQAWTGLRPGAVKPAIGRYLETPLWLAYGHYRNGILAAPATAECISRQIIASLGTD